ncbi:hypothetical protein BVY01_01690 [bacterium I07]|nr:hypothetical protein BVY01_01690 [bacterium I07]
MEPFRIKDYLKTKSIIEWRKRLWKSQYFSSEQLKSLQWELLSRLLDHCFKNVPYYHKVYHEHGIVRSDIKSLDDLGRLPLIDKDVLRTSFHQFKADNFNTYRTIETRTSGSTGTPLTLFWELNANIVALISMWRQYSWVGYRLGNGFLDIRSRVWNYPSSYRWTTWCRGLEIPADLIDKAQIHDYADLLRKYRVKLWRGHAPAMHLLASLLKEAGIHDTKPKCITPSGVAVQSYQREFLEDWAGVPVCDAYDLAERCTTIRQCPEGGYHISAELGIVEILKDNCIHAKPGQEGRIIATGLHNYAFPLIRYDTRDFAIQSDRGCACGRTLPLVESITGRVDDYIINTQGMPITGLHFAFYAAKGIKIAQIVQTRLNELDLYVVTTESWNNQNQSCIIAEIKKFAGSTMKVIVHKTDKIPYQQPGKKFKFIICKIESTDRSHQ